jgi:hypothetical protein
VEPGYISGVDGNLPIEEQAGRDIARALQRGICMEKELRENYSAPPVSPSMLVQALLTKVVLPSAFALVSYKFANSQAIGELGQIGFALCFIVAASPAIASLRVILRKRTRENPEDESEPPKSPE